MYISLCNENLSYCMHKQYNTTEHVKMRRSICPQGVSVLLQKQYIIQTPAVLLFYTWRSSFGTWYKIPFSCLLVDSVD